MVTNGFTLVFGKVAAATGIQLFTESGKQSVWGMSMSWGLLLSHSEKEKSSAWCENRSVCSRRIHCGTIES